jgi:ribosomal protein S7
MPRKGHIAKRDVAPDPVYGSTLVTKFVNSMMWGGKKSTAQGIFYKAMKNLEEKGGGDDALKLFKKAVENCKPLLEVKTRRVGGANYQVPIEVGPDRRTSLAIRWLITFGCQGFHSILILRVARGIWQRSSAPGRRNDLQSRSRAILLLFAWPQIRRTPPHDEGTNDGRRIPQAWWLPAQAG